MQAACKIARLRETAAIGAIAFSPDGKRIATGADDGTVKIWDTASGLETLTLTGHAAAISDLAFSPDGRRLATSSLDGTLRVYVLPVEQLEEIARNRLSRGFTDAECRQYLHLDRCPPAA